MRSVSATHKDVTVQAGSLCKMVTGTCEELQNCNWIVYFGAAGGAAGRGDCEGADATGGPKGAEPQHCCKCARAAVGMPLKTLKYWIEAWQVWMQHLILLDRSPLAIQTGCNCHTDYGCVAAWPHCEVERLPQLAAALQDLMRG